MCLNFLSAILRPPHGVSLNKWNLVNFDLNTLKRGFYDLTQDQNWVRLRKLRTFNSQQSQKHLYLVQNDWEKWFKKCLPPLETEKMTIICALSYKHLLCFWCCCDFKKSPLNFRGIVYQMDHILWAPSRLKMSLVIIFLEQ